MVIIHHLVTVLLLLVVTLFPSDITSESVSPSCALNYPCPPPMWNPQYQLNLSTICQPGGYDYYFIPPPVEPWGLISIDWSVGQGIWLNPNRNFSTCEATMVENARLIKMQFPQSRVFIYHNMELALQWIESQRAVMYDPKKAHWFLQYTDGKGNKNGTIYNEPISQGDQFFWDFRVSEAADYFIASILKVLSPSYVDGTFTDDVSGIPEEHPAVAPNTHLSPSEVTSIQYATQLTSQRLIDSLILAGKYNYQAFSAGGGTGPAPNPSSCATFMRQYCSPDYQKNPMTMGLGNYDDDEQIVAAFLITRSPWAWLGFGWESDDRNWRPIFDLDVGVPVGACLEEPYGVFSRLWSKGIVELDCNTWRASFSSRRMEIA